MAVPCGDTPETPETTDQRPQRQGDEGLPVRQLEEEFQKASCSSPKCTAEGTSAGSVDPSEAGASDSEWRRGLHDDEEEILEPNDARFCLLPVK